MAEPFDPHSKNYYRLWFEKRQVPVESEHESFLRARKIDLLVRCDAAALGRLQDSCFAHFRQVNSVEFKGVHDPLTLADFKRIQMRSWGVGLWHKPHASENEATESLSDDERELEWSKAAESLLPSQSTITIVCVTRPDKVLDELAHELRIQPTAQRGVYFCDSLLPTWIIHPSELALIPVNYPLLSLARGKTLGDFIELCLQAGMFEELQFTLDVGLVNDPDPLWRKLVEVRRMQVKVQEETWEYINEFLRLTPEAFEKLPVFRDAIQDAIEHAEEEGIDIGKLEGIDIGEARGKLVAQRQTLLRLLTKRFPETLEQTEKFTAYFNQISDFDALVDLIDHLLIAPTLAAFEETLKPLLPKDEEQK